MHQCVHTGMGGTLERSSLRPAAEALAAALSAVDALRSDAILNTSSGSVCSTGGNTIRPVLARSVVIAITLA